MNNEAKSYIKTLVRNWVASDEGINPVEVSDSVVGNALEDRSFTSEGKKVQIHCEKLHSVLNGKVSSGTLVYLSTDDGSHFYDNVFDN